MKLHKAPGIDGIETEHLLYSHPVISILLCQLFNSMLHCGRVPNDFQIGIIIPVVKDANADVSASNNYRGITLSPTISKLFELCIMEKFGHLFDSSDLQFGFKKSLGCSNAIFAVQSVTDYFSKHGSTVNVCALDMSKAFDKVNHFALYTKLIKCNIPLDLLHLLINWYDKCSALVRWNGALSRCVELLCGVRQGGVLSPILFALYVDNIIVRLRYANLGCSIHNVYIGCVMYADDLLLLSASVSTLQRMINICADEISYLDMRFNVSKSAVIRVGKRFKQRCSSLTCDSESLAVTDSVKYLGIHIVSGSQFTIDINKLKSRFYAALNSLLSKCGNYMNEMVTLQLINAFCRPLLLYGCDCVTLRKAHIASLTHSWNRIYWTLFKINNDECISDIQLFTSHLSITEDIAKRRLKFIYRVSVSSNSIMHFLSKFV
jgi:hypothetical protein